MVSQDQTLLSKSAAVRESVVDRPLSAGSKSSGHPDFDSRIVELVHYARDKDLSERTTLFRNLIDMFLTGKAPAADPTRAQLINVIKALIPHVDAEARQTSCDLISSITTPPMDLALCLAQDRASVVSNLLRTVPFSEEDMIDLVHLTGRAHHQELASRNDLSANVWIALARAAPAIEPSISDQELWNDQLFNQRPIEQAGEAATAKNREAGSAKTSAPSATVTELRPTGLNSILRDPNSHTDTPQAEAVDFVDDIPVFLNSASSSASSSAPSSVTVDNADMLSMTGAALDEHEQPVHTSEQISKYIKDSWEKPYASEESSLSTPPLDDSDISVFLTTEAEGDGDQTSNRDNDGLTPVASWQWQTDSRLVVQTLENLSPDISNGLNISSGSTVFDLLGLDEKPTHPVVKALNRRGTIHDVPIYLNNFPKGHRYWTLEAKPLFDLTSGAFQGYSGQLMGVMPLDGENSLDLPEDLSAAHIEYPSTPEYSSMAVQESLAEAVEEVAQEAVQEAAPPSENPAEALQNMIQKEAASHLKDLQSTIEEQVASYMQAQQVSGTSDASLGNTAPPMRRTTVLQTLDQLEKSLSVLLSPSDGAGLGDDAHLQHLHKDIVASCLRTLKAQLADE